jgi:hypothetical protein
MQQEATALARDAYVYGYPLVTMEITRRHFTNVTKAGDQRAPMGQFANMRTYPSADFRGVTAPNADTLYSAAWLDVSKEPHVLEMPDEGNRFYMMPMLDAWTNVVRRSGYAYHGHEDAEVPDHGCRLVGHGPRRGDAVHFTDRARVDHRPHLQHRHTTRLQRGTSWAKAPRGDASAV